MKEADAFVEKWKALSEVEKAWKREFKNGGNMTYSVNPFRGGYIGFSYVLNSLKGLYVGLYVGVV